MSIFSNFFHGNKNKSIAIGLNKMNTKNSFSAYEHLFLSNYCVNRAINLIASNIAKMQIEISKDSNLLPQDHFVNKILCNPSQNSFFSEFVDRLVTEYLIYGNAFIFLDDDENLVLLDIDNIEITKKSTQIFYSFIYNDKSYKISTSDETNKFAHLKNFNPKNCFYGYSFLEPIKSSVLLYQYIDDYNLSFIQNGARPSGILTVKGFIEKDEVEDLKNQFYREYSGENQAGKVIFLNREFIWQPLSGNIKDMDYTDASRRTIRAIASGLGVPPILIGDLSLAGESSRNNLDALFDVFYNTTLEPMANKISQFLTMFFCKIESGINVKFIKQNINSKDMV